MKLPQIGLIALTVATVGCFSTPAKAEQPPENIADAMNRAVFNQTGDIYRNAGIDRQFTQLVGISYSDKEYLSDSQSIERIYNEGMRLQTAKEYPVRTADLPNPFNSSVRFPNP